jgi:GMP synthase (glutamine-hydrolysing)
VAVAAYPPAMTVQHPESILIVDFGSQVTQLIARRVREAGVYCEIAPFNAAEDAFERMKPKGVIFSGGPASVTAADSPRAPQVMFDSGVPLLGICYGQQTLHQQLGGKVVTSDQKEFGRAFIDIVAPSALFDGLWKIGEKHKVWMSHGDRVETLAPGFEVVATSEGAPFAIATDEAAKRYSMMFHPEVVHTPDGGKLLANFVRHVCGCAGDWSMASYRQAKIADIRAQVGAGKVICGLSGGVDSAVAAVLIHEAIGDQLTCVFVDHGLMRLGEA